jgi:hypothetical protein
MVCQTGGQGYYMAETHPKGTARVEAALKATAATRRVEEVRTICDYDVRTVGS